MGLNLVLLPFDGDNFSQTVLPCYESREFYEELLKEQSRIGRDVPDDFRCYLGQDEKTGETCYGVVTEDAYGEPIKRLQAKQLMDFFNQQTYKLMNAESFAIAAYLEKLPPRRMVALFWK